MGLNNSTVCRDLQLLDARWKEKSLLDFDAIRQQQLDRLALLESEYWAGWERSQQDRESTIAEQLRNAGIGSNGSAIAGSGRVRQLTRTEQRVGDPQFLNGVGKCIAERSRLLGLYVETKGDRTAEDTLKDYFTYLNQGQNAQISPKPDPPDLD